LNFDLYVFLYYTTRVLI